MDTPAANIAARLTEAQARAVRDSDAGVLYDDRHGRTRGSRGTVARTTLDALLGRPTRSRPGHDPLIQLDDARRLTRSWRLTPLGVQVLGWLDRQAGGR